jgi:hypothetical protein
MPSIEGTFEQKSFDEIKDCYWVAGELELVCGISGHVLGREKKGLRGLDG